MRWIMRWVFGPLSSLFFTAASVTSVRRSLNFSSKRSDSRFSIDKYWGPVNHVSAESEFAQWLADSQFID